MRKIDLTGKRFGKLVVQHELPPNKYHQLLWRCKCDCGNEVSPQGANLRYGRTTSCGCASGERFAKMNRDRPRCGDQNGRLTATKAKLGDNYISSKDPWFRRAVGCQMRAKRDGREFGFASPQEAAVFMRSIAPECCPVFGFPFEKNLSRGFSHRSISVDRKDTSKGYTRDNIQIISMLANRLKADATPDQLKTFARWVLSEG